MDPKENSNVNEASNGLAIGLYINFFNANLKAIEAQLALADRSKWSSLRKLRETLTNEEVEVAVYAADDKVYGYGAELKYLKQLGFKIEPIALTQVPKLTTNLILDGYLDSLRQADNPYTCYRRKYGRAVAYQFNKSLYEISGIHLHRGFELQSMYFSNPDSGELAYGIIIDATFAYRDDNGQSLSSTEVVKKGGSKALVQLRIKQGDLTPSQKINLDVSQQRLMKLILPFVAKRHKFTLPCGIEAELDIKPVRITLAVTE